MKIKSVLKITSKYLLILGVTLMVAEILSRSFFPEFVKNQVYHKMDEKNILSKGQNQYFNYIQSLKYRSKTNSEEKFDFSKKTIWLFGDSVTNGYGLRFTETYYFHLNNILKKIGYNYNILATSEYGSNLKNVIKVIVSNKNLFKENDLIIYQFNYNDILPRSLKNDGDEKNNDSIRNFINQTNKYRYAYLNKSTFLRTLQHYAGIFSKKTSGACKERGLDALGQYTYAYGSKGHEELSEESWNLFAENLKKTKQLSKDLNTKLIVLISPISLQLPNHEKNNILNFDIECATIDPYEKIKKMLYDFDIDFADPLPLLIEKTNTDLKEKNLTLLYHDYDTNHPNSYANLLFAYSLFNKVIETEK